MTFSAYIQRQKAIIRERHLGETILIEKGEATVLSDSERLLEDLASFKGLNKRERLNAARAKSNCACM